MSRVSTPRVRFACDAYVATCGLAPGSAADRRRLFRRFEAHVNDCQTNSVTPLMVADFFAGLSTTCGKSSLAKYRTVFRRLFDFWLANEWTRRDLLANVPKYRNPGRRVRWQLTPGEIAALLQANEHERRNHALMVTVLNTGLRINEVTAIRIGNVDLQRGTLFLTISKTDEEDLMSITPSLDAELRDYLVWYQENAPRPVKRSNYLFPARTRRQYNGRDREGRDRYVQRIEPAKRMTHLTQVIQQCFVNAGWEVEKGEGWHTLRRSVARLAFDAAADVGHDEALRIVSALLHHKTAATTERYIGLTRELAKRDAMLLADPFNFRGVNDPENVIPLRKAE